VLKVRKKGGGRYQKKMPLPSITTVGTQKVPLDALAFLIGLLLIVFQREIRPYVGPDVNLPVIGTYFILVAIAIFVLGRLKVK